MIASYRQRYPDWLIVRLEDLSLQPIEGFQAIFQRLNLPWRPQTEAYLRQTTTREDRKYELGSTETYDVHRDSATNVGVWKQRLTPDQIATIRKITEPVASQFYQDSEW